ncbi:inositol monophosphatase family protein [Chondromyces apiculatus]|uniref:Inositol-1-monophosphatase n=1 Tax=Chondromyces apiculatus DSM 436 TaxID=1192034 RepID=A0A017T342_9BACT|nr:inositol monophosphatase family protein [Chondromyces apiculatus]EYF03643.1 Inositol-1-monophosphatase [Chondromyces apiculatus DSM 436]
MLGERELPELAAAALRIAHEAAGVARAGFRSRPFVQEKGEHDLVTQFDRASEALLVERLGALTPGVPIVAEEGTGVADEPGRAGPVWYVDPLDGTVNFVHGHPFWCVSVGLMEGDEPVVGAVVAPELNLHWVGFRARTPGSSGEAQRGQARCAVSATTEIGRAMIATGFPTQRDRAPDNNFASFEAVKRRARAVRRCGSAAIDLCMVADGTYDGYWERKLHVWDVAAGAAIVRAAGGTITALDGGAPRWHVGHLVASNGHLHAELLRVLAASRASTIG